MVISMKSICILICGSMFIFGGSQAFAKAGDAAAGKTRAAMCAGCHGGNGISFMPDVPNLKGQKEVYLAKTLRDFKSGARKSAKMAPIVAGLSEKDMDDLAAYFSSLK